nr:MAG TPA: hypothetical protein [Caudoviricetes sp.]
MSNDRMTNVPDFLGELDACSSTRSPGRSIPPHWAF